MGFFDNMKQLMEMKQKMEEVKKRLDSIEVVSENDYVKVTVTGNRTIKGIAILNLDDKERLQEKIQLAINDALTQADNVMQSEMGAVTKGMLPDVPGLS